MITLLLTLILTSSAQAQDHSYPGSMLLSELPDGARIQVLKRIDLNTSSDDAHAQMVHYCTFENGICTPAYDKGFPASLNSQLNLRTDVEDALVIVDENFWGEDTYALLPGTYCLDRKYSRFNSETSVHEDKLKFTDCAGNKLFTIYANAGYTLRNQEGFRGYTISEFEFQAGNSIRFIK